ncbi:MAG: hypothetical protein WKF96_25090, partial [Solirubrobacteraceae bacterium]
MTLDLLPALLALGGPQGEPDDRALHRERRRLTLAELVSSAARATCDSSQLKAVHRPLEAATVTETAHGAGFGRRRQIAPRRLVSNGVLWRAGPGAA